MFHVKHLLKNSATLLFVALLNIFTLIYFLSNQLNHKFY